MVEDGAARRLKQAYTKKKKKTTPVVPVDPTTTAPRKRGRKRKILQDDAGKSCPKEKTQKKRPAVKNTRVRPTAKKKSPASAKTQTKTSSLNRANEETSPDDDVNEARNHYICADNQDMLQIARHKACTLIENMENSNRETTEEPVYFLSFLENERDKHAANMSKAREALRASQSSSSSSSSLDAGDILTAHRSDGRAKTRAIGRASYDHEMSAILREETRFANLVQRFEKYYTERDYNVRECEMIEAFRRESNQTTKDTQLVFCTDKDHCPQCHQPYVYSADESTLFCTTCSYSSMYIDAKPSAVAYGDQIEFSSFSYKRINHFSEYSNHLQARESKQIPRAVLRNVMEILFTKLNITDYTKIDFLDVRNALKIMGARSYYDHVMQAWSRITGRVPMRLEPAVEELMHLMFAKIQLPWIKHRPHERKNFLSYPYVFYKFCQLLGFKDMLKYFPLLKGKVKLWQQEKTFEKICTELGWPWVPIDNLEEELDELVNGLPETRKDTNIMDDDDDDDGDEEEDDGGQNVSQL